MDTVDRHPADWRRRLSAARGDTRVRSLLVALGAGLVLVLLIGATNSIVGAARSISTDANRLSQTDESIRAGTVARTLSVLAAVAANEGAEASSFSEIDEAVDILDSDPSIEARRFVVAVEELMALIEEGGVPLPEQVAEVENSFGAFIADQMATREGLAADLASSEARLGQVSSLAGLALLFIVPTLSIGVYRALTRPDVQRHSLAHAAAAADQRNTARLRGLARGLAAMRGTAGLDVPPALADQQLAELAALAGLGADGAVRRREEVDLRMAVASALNRIDAGQSVAISGGSATVLGDTGQIVTMIAGLLACTTTHRNARIAIATSDLGAHVEATATDHLPALDRLDDPSPWERPIEGIDDRRVTAALLLARDADVVIRRVEQDGRVGFRIDFPELAAAPAAVTSEHTSELQVAAS